MAELDLGRRLRRARRHLAFLGFSGLLRATDLDGARAIGTIAGELHWRLAFRLRRRLERDVAHALARAPGDPSVRALLREAFRCNDAAVCQTLALLARHHAPEQLAALCTIDGLEHLRTALDAGRGAVLLTAHMGNVGLVPLCLAQAGFPVSIVARQALAASEGFFARGIERYGIQAIIANDGRRAYHMMVEAVQRGRILYIALDQGVKVAARGVPQRFLGKVVPMPAGPAKLVQATGAPVLPVATVAARPLWRYRIDPPLALAGASVEDDLARLVAVTEQQVRAHPELWSWHQRRWRNVPRAG